MYSNLVTIHRNFSAKKEIIQPMTMEEGEMDDELNVDEGSLEEVPSSHDRYGDTCMIRFLKISSADTIKPSSAIAVPII